MNRKWRAVFSGCLSAVLLAVVDNVMVVNGEP